MTDRTKFDPGRMLRLNDPERLELLDLPGLIRGSGVSPGSVIVDVGSGTGLFAGALLDLLPGSSCWCLDIMEEMVEWIAANRIPIYGDRMRAAVCGESSIPLADSMADLVFMMTLHHELSRPVAMMDECFRILRQGGRVIAADWRVGSRPGCPHQDRFLSPSDILKDLEAAGFVHAIELKGTDRIQCLTAEKPLPVQ